MSASVVGRVWSRLVSSSWTAYHEAPSMQMTPGSPLVSVLDGKIYVNSDSLTLMEFFDPKTQIWEHVPNPSAEILGEYILRSLVFDGKLYLFGSKKNMVYKPKENIWDVVGSEMPLYWSPYNFCCVVDNVIIYCHGRPRVLYWYDSEGILWRLLKGLEELLELAQAVRLVNYGGNLVVLWEKKAGGIDPKKKKIWCAEISLERRNKEEIYGKIEWCNAVLTLSSHMKLLKLLRYCLMN